MSTRHVLTTTEAAGQGREGKLTRNGNWRLKKISTGYWVPKFDVD